MLAGSSVLGAGFVEDLGDGAEPRPAGENLLLCGRRGPAFLLQAAQDL